MIVLSPILKTNPLPLPLLQRVPKNATFFVSKIYSGLVHSIFLIRGSLSPVKEELSTFISSDEVILISAGILSPNLTSTKSPTTSFDAGINSVFPSLITLHWGGIKFLKPSIMESLLAF